MQSGNITLFDSRPKLTPENADANYGATDLAWQNCPRTPVFAELTLKKIVCIRSSD
jgi:hypothetical protein